MSYLNSKEQKMTPIWCCDCSLRRVTQICIITKKNFVLWRKKGCVRWQPCELSTQMSKIEDEVCEEIQSRAKRGLNKYGVTMERDDLNVHEWLQHLLEELLDAAVYVKRLQKEYAEMEKNLDKVIELTEEIREKMDE